MSSKPKSSFATRPILQAAILLMLTVFACLAFRDLRPPVPKGTETPPQHFSAARAVPFLDEIAKAPHPTGSAELARIREHLLSTLFTMGYTPSLQSGLSFYTESRRAIAGYVDNIVLRIPGINGGGRAVLLVAHYDSVPTGPGAADNGASVAAALETLRALKTVAPLRNDLIVLLSDGEEAGLLGANLFLTEHEWAKDVGAVLNFDYRGNGGAMTLFQTGGNNADFVHLWASSVPHAVGDSLFGQLYHWLPNDTDFSVFQHAGLPGLNFAAAEGHVAYHTRLDRTDNLDLATLQHQGDTMLALVQALGNAPIETPVAQNRVFFRLPWLGAATYPTSYVLPLMALSLALVGAVVVAGLRRRRLRALRVLAALPACLALIAVSSLLAHGLWIMAQRFIPAYSAMRMGSVYDGIWFLTGSVLSVFAVVCLLGQLMRRWLNISELTVGGHLCWAVAAAALTLLAPAASHVLVLSLLGVATAMLVTILRDPDDYSGALIAQGLGIVPAIALIVPLIYVTYVALTPALIVVPAALTALLLILVLPLLEGMKSGVYWFALALSGGFLAMGAAKSGFDVTRPRPDEMFFVQHDASGNALWLSGDRTLDAWNGTYLREAEYREVPEVFGKGPWHLWAADAPNLHMPLPLVETLDDSSDGRIRSISLRISSRRHAPKLRLFVEGTNVISSNLNGQPFAIEPRERWMLDAYGIGGKSLRIDLRVPAGKPFRIKAVDVSYGLPETGGEVRPQDKLAVPSFNSDTAQVIAYTEFQ